MPARDYDRILFYFALPYANGPLHLGHLAGAYLPADLYARYRRMKGRDVLYVCGSERIHAAERGDQRIPTARATPAAYSGCTFSKCPNCRSMMNSGTPAIASAMLLKRRSRWPASKSWNRARGWL